MTEITPPILSRRRALRLFAAGALLPAAGLLLPTPLHAEERVPILVHHDPWCGCCTAWGDHLRGAGFAVRMEPAVEEDLDVIKERLGVPRNLYACHTAELDDYLVEGHVPAGSIRRLLRERPAARGLAVAGMPAGSPGMEGGTPEDYEVVLFGVEEIPGGQRVWERYRGSLPA